MKPIDGIAAITMRAEAAYKVAGGQNSKLVHEYMLNPPQYNAGREDSLQSFINLMTQAPANQNLVEDTQYIWKSYSCRHTCVNSTIEDVNVKVSLWKCIDNLQYGDREDSIISGWNDELYRLSSSITGFSQVQATDLGVRIPKMGTISKAWKCIDKKRFSLRPGAQHVSYWKFIRNELIDRNKLGMIVDTSFNYYSAAKGMTYRILVEASSQPTACYNDGNAAQVPGVVLTNWVTQFWTGAHLDQNKRIFMEVNRTGEEVPGTGTAVLVDADGDQVVNYATA